MFENQDDLVLLEALGLLQHLVDNLVGVNGDGFHGLVRLSPDSAEHVVSLYLPESNAIWADSVEYLYRIYQLLLQVSHCLELLDLEVEGLLLD